MLDPETTVRLLILAAQYFPVVGGSEVHTRLLARELKSRGNEVEVWTRRISAEDPAVDRLDGVSVRRMGITLSPQGRWARRAERLTFALDLFRKLRSEASRFDLVFANQLQYPVVVALLARRKGPGPVIARTAASGPLSELNANDSLSRLQRWLLLKYLDHVVTLGPLTRDECLAAGFPAARVAVIPNGIEVRSISSAPRGPAPPLKVIWLGKFRREKRADLAIRAWRQAAIPGELVLVGDGEEREAIQALAHRDPDPRAPVTLMGLREDPQPELAVAHVYLQSSDTEGMSNALLEAMGSGCACVATDVGETRFVLGGSEVGEIAEGSFVQADAGLLVRPGDAQGMARALIALVEPGLREFLGRAAETRSHAHHAIKNVARLYEDLFQALVSCRAGMSS